MATTVEKLRAIKQSAEEFISKKGFAPKYILLNEQTAKDFMDKPNKLELHPEKINDLRVVINNDIKDGAFRIS